MSDPKCPFCGEPRTRQCTTYDVFRCGTEGPDINGEYDTGRICDMHTYQRLLNANAEEIASLTARLAAAEAAMKAAASLPGRLWLTGQLALAEFLSGEGGENLDYTLEQYEAAKGGRDE